MKVEIFVAESASKKQVGNAKLLFGAKAQAIVTSLEAADKQKLLHTQAISDLLSFLKSADEETVSKYAGSVAGKNLVASVNAFVKNKSFDGKLAALGKIKFKSPAAKSTNTNNNLINKLLNTDDVKKSAALIRSTLNIASGPNLLEDGGIGDDSDSQGMYLRLKPKAGAPRPVLVLLEKSNAAGLMRKLKVSAPFAVFLDSGKFEGPFMGNPAPLSVQECKTLKEAFEAFAEMAATLGSAKTYSTESSSNDKLYDDLLTIDDEEAADALIRKTLRIKSGPNLANDGGIGDDSDSQGMYLRFKPKTGFKRPVLVLLRKKDATTLMSSLKVSAPFVVYLDSGKFEGPFLGKPDAKNIRECKTLKEAYTIFAKMASVLSVAKSYTNTTLEV